MAWNVDQTSGSDMMDDGGGSVSIMHKALLISTPRHNLKAGLDPGDFMFMLQPKYGQTGD
jgi:hypothetical protein